jgi:hypothetical protein
MNVLKVAICGGGRTGHLNAILFKQLPNVQVSMLTGNLEIIERHARQSPMRALLPDGSTLEARLDRVTTDARTAVEDADIVIITVPAHARPQTLQAIAPHLSASKPVYIGAIPGFCGFDWLAEATLPDRPNLVIWGMKDVPHTAFELAPGRSIKWAAAKASCMWRPMPGSRRHHADSCRKC